MLLTLKRGNEDLGTGSYDINRIKDMVRNDNMQEIRAAKKMSILSNIKVKKVQQEICDLEFGLLFSTNSNVSYIAGSILDRMFDMYLKSRKGKWTDEDSKKVLKYARNFVTKIEQKYGNDTLHLDALIKILFYYVNNSFNKMFKTQLLEYVEFPFEDNDEYEFMEDRPIEVVHKHNNEVNVTTYDPWMDI